MKHLSCISLLILFCLNASAQNRHSFGFSGDYGFILLHSNAIKSIGRSYPLAVGGEYSYWLLKEKSWRDCHCFPRVGVNLSYHNFDSPQILGYGIPLYGFLEPWFPLTSGLFFTVRGGAGYSYASRPHDEITNPENLAYSMAFNPFGMVGAGFAVRINDHWRVSVQARYNHISNGGQKKPNKGINYPTANLSLSYSPSAIRFEKQEKVPLHQLEMKKSLVASSFVGGQAAGSRGNTFAIPGVAIKYSHQFGRTSAWVVGTEWINNLAYRQQIRNENLKMSHHQVSFLAGHEFLLGSFTFSQMAGIYLYRDYDVTPAWYQRYAINWYFWKNLSVGTGMKAHGHVAEFIDFRISYRYNFEGQ